jgi:hypothetical protein
VSRQGLGSYVWLHLNQPAHAFFFTLDIVNCPQHAPKGEEGACEESMQYFSSCQPFLAGMTDGVAGPRLQMMTHFNGRHVRPF